MEAGTATVPVPTVLVERPRGQRWGRIEAIDYELTDVKHVICSRTRCGGFLLFPHAQLYVGAPRTRGSRTTRGIGTSTSTSLARTTSASVQQPTRRQVS